MKAVVYHTYGAPDVTVVDSGIKEEMLREMGADHFIDYTKRDFTKSAQSYDVVFDMVAGSNYSACIRSLMPGGRYVMGNPRFSYMLRSVVTTKFSDKTVRFAFASEKVDELLTLKKMIEKGTIKAKIDRVYRFEEASAAHRRVETEQRIGIVILSDGPPKN